MSTAPPTLIPMFVQVYPLPRSQCQTSILNGNVEGHAHDARLDVTWRIIVTFQSMSKRSIAIPLGGDCDGGGGCSRK